MKYCICNLKNKMLDNEIEPYRNRLDNSDIDKSKLVVIPSFLHIDHFKNCSFEIGAQDISSIIDEVVTGEVTGEQLRTSNVKYVLVGHSERRIFKKEIYIDFINKINHAEENEIKVIYCIGETLKEKENGDTYIVLEQQISEVLNNVNIKNLMIAYEPVWAIGSGNTPTEAYIKDMVLFIKDLVEEKYDTSVEVLYGGSVNVKNIADLNKIKIVDGFLVGSASLKADNVIQMINIMAE